MRIFPIIQRNKPAFVAIKNYCCGCIQSESCRFNIANGRQKTKSWILTYIVDLALYTTTVYVVFNTCIYNSNINVIFIVAITKMNCIAHTFVVIGIEMDHIINDVRRYKFVFLCIEQALINFDIFI